MTAPYTDGFAEAELRFLDAPDSETEFEPETEPELEENPDEL